MLGWSINLFRIRGIQLSLHFTFLLLLGLEAFDGWQDGGMAGMFWSSAALIAFFTCVVLHELGHSLTARRFGIGVRRILLMPIGGMAEFDSIPREPSRELLITLAGPAVNFAIAAILWLVIDQPQLADPSAIPVSPYEFGCVLLTWNLLMGFFNLIPVYPMDGGRILRALLAMKLDYVRATHWAANLAKVLSVLGIALGLHFHAYLLSILFAFIFVVGDAEYRQILRRDRDEAQWRRIVEEYHSIRPDSPPKDEPPLL